MKILFLILGIIFLPINAKAQMFDDYQDINSPQTTTQIGKVVINNHAKIKTQVPDNRKTIRGYCVRIFFDNSQNARNESQKAMDKFKKMYPETFVQNEYTAPYFKVTAGNFLTHEEAIVLWANISREFPSSFVVSKSNLLNKFTTSKVLKSISTEEIEEIEEIDGDNTEQTGTEVVVL